jgi:hypothetical protein
MSSIEPLERRQPDATSSPSLRLVTTPPARTEASWVADDEQPIELKLGFRQLVLIHRSLQALRTLRLVEPRDVLVADTLQLIEVALEEAV